MVAKRSYRLPPLHGDLHIVAVDVSVLGQFRHSDLGSDWIRRVCSAGMLLPVVGSVTVQSLLDRIWVPNWPNSMVALVARNSSASPSVSDQRRISLYATSSLHEFSWTCLVHTHNDARPRDSYRSMDSLHLHRELGQRSTINSLYR